MPFRIAFASDHAGYPLKLKLVEDLRAAGHTIVDFGCHSEAAADTSDHVAPAAQAIGTGAMDRGIFVDGAGYPSGMVANFFHGVYAAVCNDVISAKLAREHGGANVLCIGAMIIGELTAKEIVKAFIAAEPLPGKYAARREKVVAVANANRVGPLFKKREVLTVDDLRNAILNKEPLILDEKTVITPSVLDTIRGMRP